MTGSHIDTVATGGRYDGNLGVLAGLEVLETVIEAPAVELELRRPLAVAFFTDEEGTRFAPDMLGSLVYAGGLPLEVALDTVAIDGAVLGDELVRIGYVGPQPCPARPPHAYVELHIEQGPVLEAEGVTIGAVTGVQGISWTELDDHRPVEPRRHHPDATCATTPATWPRRSRRLVRRLARDDRRPGRAPSAASSCTRPGQRGGRPGRRSPSTCATPTTPCSPSAEAPLEARSRELADAEGVDESWRRLARFEPVEFDPDDRRPGRAGGHRPRPHRAPHASGAGHDAQMLARVCPAGMVFVPSVAGISHNPAEHTDPDDLEAGANVLLHVVLRLASSTVPDRRRVDEPGRARRRRADGPGRPGPARGDVVERLIAMLREAADRGRRAVVVFPELALTTFFPRWWFDRPARARRLLRDRDARPRHQAAVRRGPRLGVGFSLGYAELTTRDARAPEASPTATTRRSSSTSDGARSSTATARCTSPGTRDHEPWRPFQHLERRYFEPGPEGFVVQRAFGGIVGLLICNDRRWPETYRVLGLQGVELILIGYNTPIHYAPDPGQDRLAGLPQQPGHGGGRLPERHVGGRRGQGRGRGGRRLAGREPDHRPVGRGRGPGRRPTATRSSWPTCDLDACAKYKRTLFDFDRYRMIEHYGRITSQRGVDPPRAAAGREAAMTAIDETVTTFSLQRRAHASPRRPIPTCSTRCARSWASPRPRTGARRRASAGAAPCCSTARRW